MENNFQWTDALVAEFTSWSLKSSSAFQGRYADIEQFKVMKAPKPTYEILAYMNKKDGLIWKKECDGEFHTGDLGAKLPLPFFTEGWVKELYDIHSLRRLPDGVVFTLGDSGRYNKTVTNSPIYIIEKFKITPDNQIEVFGRNPNIAGWFHELLEDCEKAETHPEQLKLFTTEDGVDVFEGDVAFFVFPEDNYAIQLLSCWKSVNPIYGRLKGFSNIDAAKQWVFANTAIQVSYKEIEDIVRTISDNTTGYNNRSYLRDKFTSLFKTKIQTLNP